MFPAQKGSDGLLTFGPSGFFTEGGGSEDSFPRVKRGWSCKYLINMWMIGHVARLAPLLHGFKQSQDFGADAKG